jgi:DNA modification methylase
VDKTIVGDARSALAKLRPKSFNTCITSPPYFGLRDYGVDGQLGNENTPEEYVANIVAVFREVRRVLRNDGTVWLNLGDSYASSRKGGSQGKDGRRADRRFTASLGAKRSRPEGQRLNRDTLAGRFGLKRMAGICGKT